MKKLLPLVLVLAMASLASAVAVNVDFYADGTKGALGNVALGADVTITVVADFDVIGFQASIAADDGAAAALGSLNGGFTSVAWHGQLRNGVGNSTMLILIDLITGNASLGSSVAAGQDLYTFTWTAPMVEGTYTIFAPPNLHPNPFFPPPPPAYTIQADGSAGEVVNSYGAVDITVVPEPMTIALLGLGGLFLLRRRK